MSQAAVIVPIATAAIAGGAAWGGSWVGGRNERRHWLRQRRLEAYSAFTDAVIAWSYSTTPHEAPSAVYARVLVLGPESVATPARELMVLVDSIHDLEADLPSDPVVAGKAQKELGRRTQTALNTFAVSVRKVLD